MPEDVLKSAIRKATLSTKLTPVLCGSSFKNKGVQPLLDAVIDYLPSPLDVPPVVGTELIKGEEQEREVVRHADDSEPFAALAFKIAADPYVGKLTYFRVYSGHLEAGAKVLNVGSGRTERDRAHPDDARQRARGGRPRSTPATSPRRSGIKQVITGDTLAGPGRTRSISRTSSSPSRSSRLPSSPRRRSTRRRCRSRSGAWPRRTRPSRCAPTRRPARPRSRAWASCTSRCSSTA